MTADLMTAIAQLDADVRPFGVFDTQTGYRATRTTYKGRRAATRAADRLDNVYGAYRYEARALPVQK